MPCQCSSATATSELDTPQSACECATAPDSAGGCQCGVGAPTPSEGASLERVVMELDKRVRKLEAGR